MSEQWKGTEFTLDIVVPCFNEAAVLPRLLAAVSELRSAVPYRVRVLFIDDGSDDGTEAILSAVMVSDRSLAYARLSRNFGHQMAVSTGLKMTSGDAVGVIDADLQDPLDVLGMMVERLREGYDVVYGVREKRKESIVQRAMYKCHYRLLRLASETELPLDAGDFCVMSRRVVNAVNALPERCRYVRGLRAWVGFRQTGFPYERAARSEGKSKYSLGKLFKLATTGYVAFSTAPLRLAVWLGSLQILFGVGYAVYAVVSRLVFETTPSGWTSLTILFLLFGGMQVALLGIVGEYIGQIVQEVKRRPEAVVERFCGWEGTATPSSVSAEPASSGSCTDPLMESRKGTAPTRKEP